MVWLFALFAAGAVEYALAAVWTRALVANRIALTGAVTFVNVLLWGFVITTLRFEEPLGIVVHGLGCSLGAAATAWWTRRVDAPELAAPEPEPG